MTLKDGALGLVRIEHAGFLGKLVRLAVRLGILPPQRYDHTLMVYRDIANRWQVVEAATPKVRRRDLEPWDLAICDFYDVPNADAWRRADAVNFALSQVGKWYGYIGVVSFALYRLWCWLAGIVPAQKATWYCTELVATAWREAGVCLLPDCRVQYALSDELADSPETRLIEPLPSGEGKRQC